MKKSWLWLVCMAVIGVCSSARAQNAVWIDVPIIQGPSGNYTCITRPTGDMRIAIISCDPVKFNMFPPFVQQFLIAHEHGHVYQIVYNPAVMYGPYAEYDADCFAAVYLAQTDPSVLTNSVHWFETVFRFQGGDSTHGTGLQMAQRARQCAAQVGVNIAGTTNQDYADYPKLFGVAFQTGQEESKPLPLASIVSHGPDDIKDKGTPSFYTALEMIIESAHSSFWEVSDHSGAMRHDVARAIGGSCSIGGNRMSISCQFDSKGHADLQDLRRRIEKEFDPPEWSKNCVSQTCAVERFVHPGDAQDHTSVEFSVVGSDHAKLEIAIPKPSAHEHDNFKAP